MSQPRLRLEGCRLEDGIWHLDADEAHHLIRVRRCYTGSVVEGLLNGEKLELKLECRGDEVYARELSRSREDELRPRITLLLGLLKNDQMDEALRFCAETGVYEIRLLACERSVPRYEGAKLEEKLRRWEKVLDEATKQAGAAAPPLLRAPVAPSSVDFELLPQQRFAALLEANTKRLAEIKIAGECALAIGPEGDWAPAEKELLRGSGFLPVTLGARIRRASTAVAAGCAIIGALFV